MCGGLTLGHIELCVCVSGLEILLCEHPGQSEPRVLFVQRVSVLAVRGEGLSSPFKP